MIEYFVSCVSGVVTAVLAPLLSTPVAAQIGIGVDSAKRIKSSLYSLFAGLLPVCIVGGLDMIGIDVLSCVFP